MSFLPKISQAADSKLSAGGLRCEYLVNPKGLDETSPRLSWVLSTDRRAERQTAYEIVVSSAPELLASDKGDLWGSGKVTSDATAQVVYGGKALTSRQACYWKVRTWDRDGNMGPWSEPAGWEMGLLKPDDWSAKWIDAKPVPLPGKASQTLKIVSANYETLDGTVKIDVTPTVAKAVKGDTIDLLVKNDLFGGDPAKNKHKQLRVVCEIDGKSTELVVAENASFLFPSRSLPYLRKTFQTTKPVRSARLYATALGIYEMSLNGSRVGDHLLAPDWTDYSKRLQYQSYDVTSMLKTGENAIGALVADGWYAGHIGNSGYRNWGTAPALLAQLEITYADGTSDRVVTDGTWKSRGGPLLESDFMLGEVYDSTFDLKGWNEPGLNDSEWTPVPVRAGEKRNLVGQAMEPVRKLSEIAAKTVTQPAPGKWVYDLGQNMVGVVRLKLSAPAGTKITLRHAEMLNKDGTIYTTNLRGAPSIDTFVMSGSEGETHQPKFAFHGFRYVEVTGVTDQPPLDAVTGVVIGSDTPAAGQFACSDPLVNQLYSNIVWGQRGNYLSVPTDCPQRDERLGWMGDAQVFVKTATFNNDIAAFYTKWLVDVEDAQHADGRYSDVVPNTMLGFGTPAWGDAGVICSWTIYQTYGDKRVLERHLPAMTKWVEWCRKNSTDLVRDKERGSDYGDWLSIKANTPNDVIGTAYFAYSTHLVAESYRALGKTEEAEKYGKLFEQIRDAFNKRYVRPDGRIEGDTQCVYVMALKFNLLSPELRVKAAEHLLADIKAKDWHLSTGFVGVSYLLPVLTNAGMTDTAYRLLTQETFPSWLFSVKQGATTIWERWDGWTPEKGFQDPGMNSFNHYSLGSCGEWLFESVAGISQRADSSGFERVVIRPRVGHSLTSAKGSLRSIRGTIATDWKVTDGVLGLTVTIPANASAEVYVPTGDAAKVTESGKATAQAEGLKFLRMDGASAVYQVESGTYAFSSPLIQRGEHDAVNP